MNAHGHPLAAPAEIAASSAPEIGVQAVPACPVCSSHEHEPLATGFDYELQTCTNPWHFVRCPGCGHAWLNPRPAIDALPIIYPPTYYAYNYEQAIHPIAVRAKQLLDRLKIRSILSCLPRFPARYLDVGCGSGRFLKSMEALGMDRASLYGLELSEDVVRTLSADGYQVFCERVEHCERLTDSQLDLITMFHVIEHVDAPAVTVRKLSSWLAPGGVLAIETPNLDSLDARWFGSGLWGGYHIPRHWHVFTPESLARLLTKAGLEVIATRYQTGHSFWMYSLHHKLRYGPRPWPRLARLCDPFQGFLPLLALFTGFDKVRAALGFRTSAVLMLATKPARAT